jgi:5S rRNA maturation endonuclease (ribonuclease M5)
MTMIKDLTPVRIANSIEMDDSFIGATIIVEGPRDSTFFSKFINQGSTQTYIAHGKTNVLDSIAILNEREYKRALGIIDRDFSEILKSKISIENVILTDYHDIEIAIIESPAFNVVLSSLGNQEKIKEIESNHKSNAKEIIFELSKDVGILKLANQLGNLGLVFKPALPAGNPLNYSDFIDFKFMKFTSVDDLLTTTINYSTNRSKPQPKEYIKEKYTEVLKMGPYDYKHICNGHDFTFILQMALKKSFGSVSPTECSQKRIELDLIFAYDSRFFMTTTLYADIKKWEVSKSLKVLTF